MSVRSPLTNDSPKVESDTILTKAKLEELFHAMDPEVQIMDEDLEEVLIKEAESFIEEIIEGACRISKHRQSKKLEKIDVNFYLKRRSNSWLAGFGRDGMKIHYGRPPAALVSHKQRMSLINKYMKKF